MTLADSVARERIAHDLATTLVVEAAAGTGKTTALVSRIVALAGSGTTELRRVVAVTFTEKAAGEMKLRLRAAIEEARQQAKAVERGRLDQALEQLEAARIGTIHSLCGDLLRERPVEAGIDPMFEVAAEAESGALFDAAFERWFQGTLADPPEGVRRLLRRPASGSTSPRSLLRTIGLELKERRDFPGMWRRDPFDRELGISEVLRALDELGAYIGAARDRDDYLARNLSKVRNWVDEQLRAEEVRPRDFDGLEAGLRSVMRWREWNYKGSDRKFGPQRGEIIDRRDEVKALLEALVAACDADLAPLLDAELRPLVADYEQLKTRAGKLDFLDLLSKTRDLLTHATGVRQELQRRFSHLLVDEFQDTDPLQAEIVLLLAATDPAVSDPSLVKVRPGKLFLVGDPKQSIYSFRRADIGIYEGVKRRLLSQGAELLHLSVSFRSDPRIQEAVNAAFAPRMRGDGQARYVALEPFRPVTEGAPAVVALPVPAPYAHYGKLTNRSVEESLPWAVAGWIDWLVNSSGRRVVDPSTGEVVPVQARHVCLLFRRFQSWGKSVTTPYTR
jgi:ATP-dependent exoDNAse (exonuclease V) beta subunit